MRAAFGSTAPGWGQALGEVTWSIWSDLTFCIFRTKRSHREIGAGGSSPRDQRAKSYWWHHPIAITVPHTYDSAESTFDLKVSGTDSSTLDPIVILFISNFLPAEAPLWLFKSPSHASRKFFILSRASRWGLAWTMKPFVSSGGSVIIVAARGGGESSSSSESFLLDLELPWSEEGWCHRRGQSGQAHQVTPGYDRCPRPHSDESTKAMCQPPLLPVLIIHPGPKVTFKSALLVLTTPWAWGWLGLPCMSWSQSIGCWSIVSSLNARLLSVCRILGTTSELRAPRCLSSSLSDPEALETWCGDSTHSERN